MNFKIIITSIETILANTHTILLSRRRLHLLQEALLCADTVLRMSIRTSPELFALTFSLLLSNLRLRMPVCLWLGSADAISETILLYFFMY